MGDWFDQTIEPSGALPATLAGRVLIDGPFLPGSGLWDVVRAHGPKSGVTWLLEIKDVLPFISSLPADMRPAGVNNPEGGLPKNVWVGGRIEDVWPEILSVRSRVRFLIVDELQTDAGGEFADVGFENALGAWRCSNCGRRGLADQLGRRPKECPHTRFLCGDAVLLPEIHWVIHENPEPEIKSLVEKSGAVYWPDEVPRV